MFAIPFLYADENGKEYKKMICKLGVAGETAKKAQSVEEFWDIVCKKNERLCKFNKTLGRKKSLAKKVDEIINKSIEETKDYYDSLDIEVDNSDSLIIRLLKDLGALKVNTQTKLYVVNDANFEAFATPDMRIFLCNGLLMDKMKYSQILGICAREFAHCILQHAKVRIYEVKKRERQDSWMSGVQTVLNAGTGRASIDESIREGKKVLGEKEDVIFESAALKAKKYRYEYSWEQEIEADIIACKFIEYMGYNAAEYIESLRVMKKCIPKYLHYSDKSTHPTVSYRIGLLEYMVEHPKIIRNKQ